MGNLAKERINIPCPKCRKDIIVTYYELYTKREAKCNRCGSFYKYNSIDAHRLYSAINEFEKAEKKFDDAVEKLFKSSDITIKN